MEEDCFEPEHRQHGVRRVEVYVGQHVGHDVVDDVLEAGDTVQEQGDPLRGDPLEETRHNHSVEVPENKEHF